MRRWLNVLGESVVLVLKVGCAPLLMAVVAAVAVRFLWRIYGPVLLYVGGPVLN